MSVSITGIPQVACDIFCRTRIRHPKRIHHTAIRKHYNFLGLNRCIVFNRFIIYRFNICKFSRNAVRFIGTLQNLCHCIIASTNARCQIQFLKHQHSQFYHAKTITCISLRFEHILRFSKSQIKTMILCYRICIIAFTKTFYTYRSFTIFIDNR